MDDATDIYDKYDSPGDMLADGYDVDEVDWDDWYKTGDSNSTQEPVEDDDEIIIA